MSTFTVVFLLDIDRIGAVTKLLNHMGRFGDIYSLLGTFIVPITYLNTSTALSPKVAFFSGKYILNTQG